MDDDVVSARTKPEGITRTFFEGRAGGQNGSSSDGGTIYLGVEDDGSVTGLHPTRPAPTGLPAMIANRTRPP